MRKSTLVGTDVSNRPKDLVDSTQKGSAELRQHCFQIRQREQDEIQSSLLAGHIIQVCGPPLSGKSTLVQQAIVGTNEGNNVLRHDFTCEMTSSVNDVLHLIAMTLNVQPSPISSINEEEILSILTSRFMNFPNAHHVLVFHKCHNLRHKAPKTEGPSTFLGFLRRMADHLSEKFQLTIILTSRKKYRMKGHNTHTVETGMLNYCDITHILQHYAGKANVVPYASICLNMLPLPGAVKLFGAKYISDAMRTLPPSLLEEKIAKDDQFWSEIFESQLNSVETWLPRNVLSSMVHFSQFFGRSFHEGHLECTFACNNKEEWQKVIKYLRGNYIVWSLPGTDRLVVHPLLVYFLNKSRSQKKLVLCGKCYDSSCNRYTDFLCRLLRCTEINMEKLGKKGLVYGCLALEWPNIHHMIDMAIKCNENTYKLFLKAAVSARGIIFRCVGEEAHAMYSALLECANKYGTVSEQGVVEALLGHCKAFSAVLSKGGTWQQAEACLDSAIEKLRKHGPAFALMWAISRKAIILTRQAKYKESQMCFKAARRITVAEAVDHDLKDVFGVSSLQIKEEKITRDIYTANTLIFLGENGLAKEILQECYQDMQNEFADHPELATAINSLGLIEERGNHDIEKALEKYMESYKIRQNYANFNREILVVSLNNIGMIHLRLGRRAQCKKCLTEALNIRRDLGWVHANTALTLTHLSVLNLKCGDFTAAYKNTQEADTILQEILCNHDTRLRINNTLGHLSQILGIQRQLGQNDAAIQVERSAKGYFAHSVEIASRTAGNHSDDGYHHLLMAHEHAMLLALGHSEEDYNRHKDIILPYFEVHETVGKKVFVANEKIPNHKDLYSYFSSTDYKTIDKRVFISHLVKACEFCQIANPFYSAEEMWCRDNEANTDSEKDREVTESIVRVHEDELACSLANNNSEQEDSMQDNLDNTDSANSDLSNSACIQQDEKPLSSSANFSLVYQMAKSREDLEKYKTLYLSTVSGINKQESLLSSPAGNLNFKENVHVSRPEIFTNNNNVSSGRHELTPENLHSTTPDSSHLNNNSNTEYTSSSSTEYTTSSNTEYTTSSNTEYTTSNDNTLNDHTSNNQPASLVKDSTLDNSQDNVRLPEVSLTFHHSNANMLKLDKNYLYHEDNNFSVNISHVNSTRDCLVNNNDIITYDDDYDYTDDDDYNDDYDDGDIISGTIDVNESHQHVHPLSGRNGEGYVDYNSHQAFPSKTYQIRSGQSSQLLALNNPEMSDDMKDALNQNFEPGNPAITQFQHSSADGELFLHLDNKQFQANDNARLQGNDMPTKNRNQ